MAASDNPYRPPRATVSDIRAPAPDSRFAAPGVTVPAGHGARWIGEGWRLFKAAPLMWIVVLVILFGVQALLNVVPVLGGIAGLLTGPIFMVGVLAFAQGLSRGDEADISQLFVGFREKMGSLVVVALLYFVLTMVVVAIAAVLAVVLLGSAVGFNAADPAATMEAMVNSAAGLGLAVLMLLLFGGLVLVAAAYWFAPGLVFYAGLSPTAAMRQSFAACLRNWLPFLVYGLLSLLVILGGTLVFFIGAFLLALPVLMASYYPSFRDIFEQR